jgi:hypothetical protein
VAALSPPEPPVKSPVVSAWLPSTLLGAAVTPVRAALAGVAVAAGPITKNLQPLLDAKPTQFTMNTRGPGGAPKFDGAANRPYQGSDVDWDGEAAAQSARDDWANSGFTQKNKRNIAVAQAEINGQFVPSTELRAISGENPPPDAISDPDHPLFDLPEQPDGKIGRNTDGEYRLLENLAARLKPDSTGTIDLYTENHPCEESCQSVIDQFRAKFPGVKLNVTYTNPLPGS